MTSLLVAFFACGKHCIKIRRRIVKIIDQINQLQKELLDEKQLNQELNDTVFRLDSQLNNIKAAKIFWMWQYAKKNGLSVSTVTSLIKFSYLSLLDKFNYCLAKWRYKTSETKHFPFMSHIKNERANIQPANLTWQANGNLLTLPKLTAQRSKSKWVDVIIPWYGDENIFSLLPTLIKVSGKTLGQIIVINDAYPDQDKNIRLATFITRNYDGKVIYRINNKNLGFPGAANYGMKIAKHDFVLLNSDTIPTTGWLAEMHKVACADEKIATVTPMSNNATIFSVPKFLCVNEDDDPELTAEQLQIASQRRFIPVPTGHGFAMYIKKSVYDEIGELDAQAYGRGYGEENDWCCRANLAGYYHVAATRAYVKHLEGQSFGYNKKRDELIASHIKILNHRYPGYDQTVQDFIRVNPFALLQTVLTDIKNQAGYLQSEYELIILHTSLFEELGGIEIFTKEIMEKKLASKDSTQILLYFFDKRNNRFEVDVIYERKLARIFVFNHGDDPDSILCWLLQVFRVKKCMIQHLMNHSLHYDEILGHWQIPIDYYIHDFYSICQIPDLIVNDKFAGLQKDNEYWDQIYREQKLAITSHKTWLAQNKRLLESKHLNQVIFNSAYARDVILQTLNIRQTSMMVVRKPM